jgi:hypothetical protein
VYGITDDRNGRLWLSSGSGVFTLAKQDLHDYAAGRRATVASVVYGLEHGLPSTLCALSHDPVITTDAQGRVWAATLGGVVSIDAVLERGDSVPPPVLLESVTVDQVAFAPGTPVEVPHGRGSLAFRFAAPSFRAPDRIVFRYRLEGFDPSWSEGSASREVPFTNIPPGRYRFVVMARNSDGIWSKEGASAEVYLVPRFYQRAWFLAVVAAGIAFTGIGIGLGVHRVRIRRLHASERELARRVDESLAHIKMLRGLLPICAWCKRVRDDEGYWTQMEAYVRDHSQAEFSHGLCPDCLRENFPEDAAGVEAASKDGQSGPSGV